MSWGKRLLVKSLGYILWFLSSWRWKLEWTYCTWLLVASHSRRFMTLLVLLVGHWGLPISSWFLVLFTSFFHIVPISTLFLLFPSLLLSHLLGKTTSIFSIFFITIKNNAKIDQRKLTVRVDLKNWPITLFLNKIDGL